MYILDIEGTKIVCDEPHLIGYLTAAVERMTVGERITVEKMVRNATTPDYEYPSAKALAHAIYTGDFVFAPKRSNE